MIPRWEPNEPLTPAVGGVCQDCGGGSGWWYLGPTRCLDGVIRWFGWVACATCNDDGQKPKPRIAPMPHEALS